MKNILKYALLTTVLALTASSQAHAFGGDHDGAKRRPGGQVPGIPNRAPEVDPSLAIGGLTLLGGTLTVLRARRRK